MDDEQGDDPPRPRLCCSHARPRRPGVRGHLVGAAPDQGRHRPRPDGRQGGGLPAGRRADRRRARRPRRRADQSTAGSGGRQPGRCRSRSPSSTPSSSEDSACCPSPASSQHRSGRLDWCRRARFGTEDGRAAARAARQPSRRAGLPRARPRERCDARGGRVLGRAHPRPARLATLDTVDQPGRDLQADSSTLGLQRSVLQTAVSLRRLSVHVGRDERAAAGPIRDGHGGARRLRLFGVRLARVQAPGLCRGGHARRRPARPDDLRDGGRGAAGASGSRWRRSSPGTSCSSARPGRGRSRPRSTTWASISAAAGSSSPRTRAWRSRR